MSKKQSKRDAFYSFEKRMRKMLRIHRANAHRAGYIGAATSFTIKVVRSNSVLGPAHTTTIHRHGHGALFMGITRRDAWVLKSRDTLIDPKEFATRGAQ